MRKYLHLRALLGVLIVVAIGSLFLFFPLSLHWLRDHKAVDAAIMAAGVVFHLWNTYETRPPNV